MKVYIVYVKDGFGGYTVDKVFLNKDAARECVTNPSLIKLASKSGKLDKEKLQELQDRLIEEHEVIK